MSIILAISGPNKTAKTSLAATAPKDLRHFDLDLGFDRVAHRFKEEIASGQIISTRYPTPQQGLTVEDGKVVMLAAKGRQLKGVRELWENLLQDYVTALMDPKVKTVVIDTASQQWEMCHRGFLQEKQEAVRASGDPRENLLPIEYGEPNARMRAFITSARTYDTNLILVHYEKPEYVNKPTGSGVESYTTGRMEMDGFKHTDGLCDMKVWTFLRDNLPHCRVELCGLDLRMQGMEFREPTWDMLMESLEKLRAM